MLGNYDGFSLVRLATGTGTGKLKKKKNKYLTSNREIVTCAKITLQFD